MFRLSANELTAWRSHFVMSNSGAKMSLRRAPFAFTEHGALMAATVLNSPTAVQASLHVVRAFVRLRQFLLAHAAIARKLEEHESKLSAQDNAIVQVMNAIRQLMTPIEQPKRRPIGFITPESARGD